METSKSSSIKKAQIPSVCHFCEENKTIQWKCIDCDLLLCNSCKVKVHSKIKSADKHNVISLKDIGKEQKAEQGPINITCKTHPGYNICLYCMNCDVVACPNCVSETHTKHHLENIDKIHEDELRKLTYIKDELQADLNRASDNEKKFNEKKARDKQKYEVTKKDIISHLAKLKQAIDKEGDKILKRLESDRIDRETANTAGISTCLCVQEDIRSKTSIAEQTINGNNTATIVRTQKKLSSEFGHRGKLSEKNTEIKSIDYLPGNINYTALQNMIGILHLNEEERIKFELLKSHETDLGNVTNLYACKDGHVFVCDEHYRCTMKKIMLQGSGFKTVQELKKIRVFAITETENHDFILSLTDQTCLKRIKANGSIEDFKDFSPWLPRALHFTTSGYLLMSGREQGRAFPVTDISKRQLLILNNKGKVTHEYNFDEKNQRLFSMVFRIKTTQNNDIVVIDVLDSEFRGRVVALRHPNTVVWTYNGQSDTSDEVFFTPMSIEISNSGCIAITDRDNQTLHVLSQTGSLMTVFHTKDIGITYSPIYVTLDSNNRLWIGSASSSEKNDATLYVVKVTGF